MIKMDIKVIESNDVWDDYCGGWYDLYSVDSHFIYPLSDWWDNDPVPKEVLNKFSETLNGSKVRYDDMIKAIYWDLLMTSEGVWSSFEDWCDDNWGKCTDWMVRCLLDSGVSITLVGHDTAYSDMLLVQRGRFK